MQKVTILCTGKLKEKFYLDAVAGEIRQAAGRFCKLEVIELRRNWLPEDPSCPDRGGPLKEADCQAKLPNGCLVIICVWRAGARRGAGPPVWRTAPPGASHRHLSAAPSRNANHEAAGRSAYVHVPMTFPHLLQVTFGADLRAYQINAGSRYHK